MSAVHASHGRHDQFLTAYWGVGVGQRIMKVLVWSYVPFNVNMCACQGYVLVYT